MKTFIETTYADFLEVRAWVEGDASFRAPEAILDAAWAKAHTLENDIATSPAEGMADMAIKLKLLALIFEEDRQLNEPAKALVLSIQNALNGSFAKSLERVAA